ncbi:MAG: divalent-cation tolerance protein CutA [Kiloniellales bacterium]
MIEFHVTYASEDDAAQSAARMIEERLAACANIIPQIRSLYRWQGRIEDEYETLAIYKTSEEKAEQLAIQLAATHPYDTPAIIRHDNVTANSAYEDWIREETKSE